MSCSLMLEWPPQEFSEVPVRFASLAGTHSIFVLVVTGFLLHERVGILFDLRTHLGVLLQVGLQRGMVLHEFVVVNE